MEEYVIPAIVVKKADITSLAVDAIVNPANSFGYMGGGVAGAIKKAGGLEIEDEAISHAPIQVGMAVSTSAGSLPCKAVIHSPTVHNPGERTDSFKVACALDAALELAESLECKTVAVPAIGSGAGGLSISSSAKAIVDCIKARKYKVIEKIILVALDDDAAAAFEGEVRKRIVGNNSLI